MRYVRTILAILIGISLLSLGLVASLYFIITPERVQTRVSNTLNDHFGLELSSSAEFKIQRMPRLTVTIPKSVLRFNTTSNTAEGSIDKAVITLNPFAYFAKKPKIESIAITGLSLKLHQQDVENFLAPKPLESEEIVSIDNLTSDSTTILVVDQNSTVFRLDNAKFSMRDITETGAGFAGQFLIQTKDFSGSTDLSAVFNWSKGSERASAENITLSAHGLWQGTDLTAQAVIASMNNPFGSNTRLQEINASAKLANGYAFRFTTPVLTRDHDKINAQSSRTSLQIPIGKNSDTFVISADLNYFIREQAFSAQSLRIETFSLASEKNKPIVNGSVTGETHWDIAAGEGHLLLEGIFRNTPLKIDTTVFHPVKTQCEESLDVSASQLTDSPLMNNPSSAVAVPNTETTDAQKPDFSVLERPQVNGEVTIGQLGAGRLANLLSSSGSWFTQFDWNLKLAIGLKDAPLNIQRLEGNLLVQNGMARIEGGQILLHDTILPFNANVDHTAHWSVNTHWQNLQSENLFIQPVLTGLCTGALYANGVLSDLNQTVASIEMTVRDGEISGADLTKVNEIMVRERPEKLPREIFTPQSRTPFSTLSAKASLTNGVWSLSQLTANGPQWKADFSGQSYAHMLTLQSTIHFFRESGENAFNMPSIITIRRNESPVWNPEWDIARQSANTNLGELTWSFDLFKNRAKREFDQWWDSQEWFQFDFDFTPSDWLPDFEWPQFTYPEWVPEWVPHFGQDEKQKQDLPI